MGYTCLHRDSGETDLSFFRRQFNWADTGMYYKLVDGKTVNSIFYGALRILAPKDEKLDGYVKAKDGTVTIGLVVIIKRGVFDDGLTNFCYKDMDETQGPFYTACPESILSQLSEIKDNAPRLFYAREWRNKCIEYGAREEFIRLALTPGCAIEFQEPIGFGRTYGECGLFRVLAPAKGKRNRRFVGMQGKLTGVPVNLPKRILHDKLFRVVDV